jgi:ABC-type lipoprotein export system ATPase subunit
VLARIAKDPTRGVLVVTHDPRTVPFADRIVRIEDGRIVGDQRANGAQIAGGGQISVIEGRKSKRKRVRS